MNDKPSISTLFLSFLRLGMTAFGGPAMVAHIREMSVTRHKWLDAEEFRDGVALCQTIPGATAMQTAAYVGLRAGGIAGALSSFIGFGLPAFLLMLILSALYAEYHALPKVASLFQGLQVAVVAIVAQATYSFGKSTFRHYRDVLIALGAALLLLAGASPFVVIPGAALAGTALLRSKGASAKPGHAGYEIKPLARLISFVLAGLLALYIVDKRLFSLAALMMKIDLFAFGGGFASVPLMLHEIVGVRGWMDSRTFMDGIALGQVTPGPIVITATFVGFLLHGLAGAVTATAAIFLPSFLLVIALTPVFDRLKASAYFAGAIKGILASFVGLLFFISLKFALAVPWDLPRVVLGLAVLAALFRKTDILYVVLVTAAASVVMF